MLGQILGAILGGGATGLLGTALTSYLEHLNKKLQLEHEVEMAHIELARLEKEAELQLAKAQLDAQTQTTVARVQADSETARAEEETRRASYEHDKASYGILWLDAVRGLVRPVLTLYLSIVCTLMYVRLEQALEPGQVQPEALMATVQTILYTWTTAVTWWFGSRIRKQNQ